jgi:AraC-like DNA-binding protein
LYDPAIVDIVDGAAVRAWKPLVAGVREVLHARFADHAYPPHTHDVWTLFIVDEGAIRYDLGRHERFAERSTISILPPGVVHDGRPGRDGGYRKRVAYLEPDVLGEDVVGPAVDAPALADPALRAEVLALFDALAAPDADAGHPLEAEIRLAFVADGIRSTVGRLPADADHEPDRADHAEALRAFLDARPFESVTMADASAALGSSTTRLARAFAGAFGIAPHAYVLGRRLEAARDRILEGEPLAEVAVEVGFCDQAHLTRAFKRFLGVTPGAFRP